MTTHHRRAVVVGAGIAGLATALRLDRADWEVLVVERAAGRRSGGYAVTFAGQGYDAAERLGVLPRLAERHITPDRMDYVRPDGRTRFSVPGPTVRAMMGSRSLNILRGDIEDVLYTAVTDAASGRVEIRFGSGIADVRQDPDGVDVTLDDGTVERAALLVGADGLHSTTRRLVFGPEEDVRLDLDHMVGVFMLDQVPDGVEPGVTASLTDTGRTLAVVSVGPERAVAFFGYRTDHPQDELAEGPRVALPRAYGDMGWVAPQVLAQLDGAESVYFDTISQMVVDRWSRGRVVLLGDAAWCVTLFAGYGSSLAVAGADALGSALERHPDDLPTALHEWEAEIRPEAERKQQLGRQVKGLYAPADPFRLWLRDLPLRLASFRPVSALLQRRLQLTS
ncbi:FAD-dependent oxidoreductase [Isoptericola sp. BMS4]|uniref:FAD-dependent oxidoreductase n=1 Tax=Isoptericola sp. BMS4 TaxID=2527875 RepID=UPI00141DAD94|nr:FAD-dependent oxidoreductase [Isoptericola sp. BMS4]